MSIQERIMASHEAVLQVARERYGFDLPVAVRLDLRGLCAGQAAFKMADGVIQLTVRYNVEAFQKDEAHFVDTISHELAHIIAFWISATRYGRVLKDFRGHGPAWADTCVALGGSGERCHKTNLTRARKMTKHVYVLPLAGRIEVGPKIHSRLQGGAAYRVPRTGEKLTREAYEGRKS